MPLRGRSCLPANSRCSRDGWGYSHVPIFRKRNLLSNLASEIAMAPASGGSVASATPSRWKTFPHADTRHSLSQSKRHPSEPEGTKCPCYPLFLSPAHAVSQAPRPPRPRARYVAIRSTHTLKDRRTPTRRRIPFREDSSNTRSCTAAGAHPSLQHCEQCGIRRFYCSCLGYPRWVSLCSA